MQTMKTRTASILSLVVLLAACGKHDEKTAEAVTSSAAPSTAAATKASDPALPEPDKSSYSRELNLSLSQPSEADWKSFYQTTLETIADSNTTTVDQLAAIKFPGYASIRNPFDKQKFQDAHKADLVVSSKTPAKLKLLFDGRGYYPVIMYAGDPLKGHYEWQGTFQQIMVGYSWENVTDAVDTNGIMHEKRISTAVRYHLNAFDPHINRKYEKDVPLDDARQIESKLTRDRNGAENLPAVVYATIQSVQVTGSDDQSSLGIDVNLAVDGFDVAVGRGKEIKPLFK